MLYALLGPVQVSGEGTPLEVKGTLRRTLLAALLLRPNEVVSADQLADLLWGDQPSVAATTSLYNQVMRLRRALGPLGARIRAVPPGYVIDVGPGELDTVVFAEHCTAASRAAQAGNWAVSVHEYGAALALWRGEPLADVPALQSNPAIQQLTEERILAVQGRIEADLRLARHDQVIGELRTLIERHPWREAFHSQLMLALYRAGRQPEALDVYRELHRAVADEFGVEPGEAVRDLHTQILRSDPDLALQPAPTLPVQAAARQLPADTKTFTGRERELDALIAASRGSRGGNGPDEDAEKAPTVVISAINGMGGIGKTALAVRAAHRLAEHYPDGQLFIDLHGHSTDLDPVSPQDALDYLLRSLGVEPEMIPQELQERAALYRSHLAGTRTLVLLDNAHSAMQMSSLIPAEPGCLVIVTSRTQLTALDDADFLTLDTLAPHEAVALLSKTAGTGRLDEHDPAAAELAEWCGRLPLALRIIGARLRHRPLLTPEALLAALHADNDPLARLKENDRDITRVFASSLDILPEPDRRLFAHLGLIPGPDFDPPAAAVLLGTDIAEAERSLESLLDHSLLIQHEQGRYRLHDLLRAYARTRAAESSAEHNTAAQDRLLDYYAETTQAATELWFRGVPALKRVARGAQQTETPDDAKAWLDAECENLLSAIHHEPLDSQRRARLATKLSPYLSSTGPLNQVSDLLLSALSLARALDDTEMEASVLRQLGGLYNRRGMQQDAALHLHRALEIHRRTGNRLGEARVLSAFSRAYLSTDISLAMDYARLAIDIFWEVKPEDQADLLNFFTAVALENGRHEEGREFAQRLLERGRETGDRFTQGRAFFYLSHASYALGQFDEIEPALVEARRHLHDKRQEVAAAAQEFGRLQTMRGRYAEAIEHLEEALEVFTELGFALGIGYAHGEIGRAQFKWGHPDLAAATLETGLRVVMETGQRYPEGLVRTHLGYVHIARGEFAAAEEQLRLGLEVSRTGGFLNCHVEARVGLCALAHARDGAASALPHYREVLEFVRAARHPREEAAALVGLGRCELETGDWESGTAHLNEAIDLYTRMGSALDVAETQAHLSVGFLVSRTSRA